MSIFAYDDYRDFLRKTLAELPQKGRGEITKMAKALGIHPTLMSLVISGKRELSNEQVFHLAEYLRLGTLESEFLTLLVLFSRAGNHRYKAHLKEKIAAMRRESRKIGNRFEHEKTLTEIERSVFYSSWLYSAIRLYASVGDEGKTADEIAARFGRPRPRVVELLAFLQSAGLVVQAGDRYRIGPLRTFLEPNSPHSPKHHANWRNKALQKADMISDQELMFTSPISLSQKDFAKIRERIASLLKEVSEIVRDSPAEDVGCLNIDLFWVDR
jgi:uncharacterized protein (TIGR02147 family)